MKLKKTILDIYSTFAYEPAFSSRCFIFGDGRGLDISLNKYIFQNLSETTTTENVISDKINVFVVAMVSQISRCNNVAS